MTVIWALVHLQSGCIICCSVTVQKITRPKEVGRTYRAEYNLLLSTYVILTGSSQRQQLPTGNALFDLSSHRLPKAPELFMLDIHLSISPIHPEKKSVVA